MTKQKAGYDPSEILGYIDWCWPCICILVNIGVYGYMSIQIDDSGDGINQMAMYMEIGWVKESMFIINWSVLTVEFLNLIYMEVQPLIKRGKTHNWGCLPLLKPTGSTNHRFVHTVRCWVIATSPGQNIGQVGLSCKAYIHRIIFPARNLHLVRWFPSDMWWGRKPMVGTRGSLSFLPNLPRFLGQKNTPGL